MSIVQRVLVVTALPLYAGLVFILDVITPLGIDVWVLNLPVILVPVLLRRTRLLVYFGPACSAMLAFGWLGSPEASNPAWWDILNRGLGLATLWLIAAMGTKMIKGSNRLDNALLAMERSEERLSSPWKEQGWAQLT
jgi:hypothetical protein